MTETKEKKYICDDAQLIDEWDWSKNNELDLFPNNLLKGSHKKAWWRCANGHSYELSVRDRAGLKNGCPICSGQMIVSGLNDFATRYPELAKEWHPTLNGTVTPSEIAPKSNKKFYWICEKGHTYDALNVVMNILRLLDTVHLARAVPNAEERKALEAEVSALTCSIVKHKKFFLHLIQLLKPPGK